MIQTTIRLPEKLYENLKQEAKKRGMSLNAYLISVLWSVQEKLYEVADMKVDANYLFGIEKGE